MVSLIVVKFCIPQLNHLFDCCSFRNLDCHCDCSCNYNICNHHRSRTIFAEQVSVVADNIIISTFSYFSKADFLPFLFSE